MDSKIPVVFMGNLVTARGEEPVEVRAKVWLSGRDGLPPELFSTAQEKLLFTLSAYGREKTLEELNQAMEEVREKVRVFAGSPPICWNPASTSLKRI